MTHMIKTTSPGLYRVVQRDEIEKVLRSGQLFGLAYNGKWYRLRSNGMLKLWKTRPNEFQLPYKVGFKGYGRITHDHMLNGETLHPDLFRHADDLTPWSK